MAIESGHPLASPSWFVTPGESDFFAWLALGILFLSLYAIVVLYAAFDRWAEHKSHGTPLARTIPTMLAIALLYEIFPLGHFNILLPISAIFIALMADWSRFHLNSDVEDRTVVATVSPALPEQMNTEVQTEETKNV